MYCLGGANHTVDLGSNLETQSELDMGFSQVKTIAITTYNHTNTLYKFLKTSKYILEKNPYIRNIYFFLKRHNTTQLQQLNHD